ncbi:heme exporter protein CcmB [Parafilimonas sp.]|uniref:heme exporter protein CcmB n=1 Tax=Parafilimonas sp. TaxID=1969739 RepID=UPI0039E23548
MKNFSRRQITALVKKDVLLEARQQYTFYGVLLYVASTVFVVYLTNGQPEDQTWNALFWMVQLFVSVNAVAKSFLQDSKGRMLYYYTIAGAVNFITGKIIFNALLMLLMSLLTLLIFALLLGNPVIHFIQFVLISFLGGVGLGLVFTFLAAIAAKAQQQSALMAIMGFPIVIPQLLLLGKISSRAFSDVLQGGWWQMVLLLIGLDILIVLLSIILFPFLWRD